MDAESLGAGAGGGLLAAILSFFGLQRETGKRLDRMEKDIEAMQKGMVWRNTCAATHEGVKTELQGIKAQQDKMDAKLDHLIARNK